LSAGQKQRIALARALFGDPQVLVFDEPNSNLDSDGDMALIDAIGELKKLGRTVIIVSHRSSAITRADLLLLMEQGQARAFGPRDEVIRKMHNAGTGAGGAPGGAQGGSGSRAATGDDGRSGPAASPFAAASAADAGRGCRATAADAGYFAPALRGARVCTASASCHFPHRALCRRGCCWSAWWSGCVDHDRRHVRFQRQVLRRPSHEPIR